LSIERERLKTAVKIEKERNIVFPETTIIIRDIQKLTEAVYGGEEAQAEQKKLLPSEIMRKRHER